MLDMKSVLLVHPVSAGNRGSKKLKRQKKKEETRMPNGCAGGG